MSIITVGNLLVIRLLNRYVINRFYVLKVDIIFSHILVFPKPTFMFIVFGFLFTMVYFE